MIHTGRLLLIHLQDLDKANRIIEDLEADLQTERSRLRALTTEQSRIQRQRDDVLVQLQRTESVRLFQGGWNITVICLQFSSQDMDAVKKQLQKFKQENHDLESELRS